jgi:hypothetical protein
MDNYDNNENDWSIGIMDLLKLVAVLASLWVVIAVTVEFYSR